MEPMTSPMTSGYTTYYATVAGWVSKYSWPLEISVFIYKPKFANLWGIRIRGMISCSRSWPGGQVHSSLVPGPILISSQVHAVRVLHSIRYTVNVLLVQLKSIM